MTIDEKLQEIEKIHDAYPVTGLQVVVSNLIEICREQQYEIKELWRQNNRIKSECKMEEW